MRVLDDLRIIDLKKIQGAQQRKHVDLISDRITDLLVLDDWGLTKLNQEQRHDLLGILEDRNGLRSTLFTSQFPVEHSHELIGDPTLADAILDCFIYNQSSNSYTQILIPL